MKKLYTMLMGTKGITTVNQSHALSNPIQVISPVNSWISTTSNHNLLAGKLVKAMHIIEQVIVRIIFFIVHTQRTGSEGTIPTSNDDSLRQVLTLTCGNCEDAFFLFKGLHFFFQMNANTIFKTLKLGQEIFCQFGTCCLRKGWDIVDFLLRVENGWLTTKLWQTLDNIHSHAT